jgi:uncharacterized protein
MLGFRAMQERARAIAQALAGRALEVLCRQERSGRLRRERTTCGGGDNRPTMSQQNVDTVQSYLRAFAEGNLDAVFAVSDPACELQVSDAYFDAPRTYRGHQGMRELFAAQAEVFDPFRLEPEEFLDAGDRVLVIARAGGLARRSGVEVMGRFGHLWTVRDGKIVHFKEFKDPAEGLAAAGLSD